MNNVLVDPRSLNHCRNVSGCDEKWHAQIESVAKLTVDSARPILRGTASLAKLTKANASAAIFFWSSTSPKSGQCPVACW